ncbi:MAG TPA: hydrogenase iron-sulfur subunit [Dehalococcoidia bacterium]|nr:hydrogenase iron-sulfur subunit [Dehalococcoidia bacterium]
MPVDYEPKIIGFLCNWCAFAGADLAGTTRTAYPSNIRIIRVPCSGRVDPLLVLKAFQQGADAVMIAGCHPGDCHYVQGNYYARRRFALLRQFLDYLGIEKERLRLEWVSASEGRKFARLVKEMTEEVARLGPRKDTAVPLSKQAVAAKVGGV